ncbi:MAG: hypothetical protein EOO70_06215 [Myxococcaceae bacterium]|nr:MAG: hypothetical protein EOO70_06215 [Myxococcaceae bacterium]
MATENYLGWTAGRGKELWKSRAVEVGKLKKAMARTGVSLEDLRFALALSRREHAFVTSPVALVYRVERARERAVETVVLSDVAVQIQDAIDFEMDQQLAGWEAWVSRLSRCTGDARHDVFVEWSQQRLAEAA